MQTGLTVHFAEVDVTPPELLTLGGYTERGDQIMQEGGEPLMARTMVLKSGSERVALVAFETLTIPESLVVEVRRRIPDDVRLMLVATHTHSAPDSQRLNARMSFAVPGIASFNRRWLEWTADLLARSVRTALDSEGEPLAEMRVSQTAVNLNNGRRRSALPDTTLTAVTGPGHRRLLTVYSAHPTFFDSSRMQTHGDWPGAVMRRLGGLALTGSIGDVSPRAAGDTPVEKIVYFVDKVQRAGWDEEAARLSPDPHLLEWSEEKIALGEPKLHPEFNERHGIPEILSNLLVQRFAPSEASVKTLNWGGLLIVGIPGEPTSALGRRILRAAAELGFPQAVVVSHCNGWIGYVLERGDFLAGGYEATLSFFGETGADRVYEAVRRSIERLSQSRNPQTR